MSQVIVTKDALASKREASRAEEAQIDRQSCLTKWSNAKGAYGLKPAAGLIGVALSPIVMFWAAMGIAVYVALTVVSQIFKIVGAIFPRQKLG